MDEKAQRIAQLKASIAEKRAALGTEESPLSKEERIAQLRASIAEKKAALSESGGTPEEDGSLLNDVYTGTGKVLRTAARGLNKLRDTPYIPADIYNWARGNEPVQRPGEIANEELDRATEGKFIPTSRAGKIASAVGEYAIEGLVGGGAGLKGLGKIAQFMRPTKSGALGVAAGQAVLNETPDNVLGSIGANLATTFGAKKLGKAAQGISSAKTKFDLQTNKTHQKAMEKELGKISGGDDITNMPANMSGLNIEGSNKAYRSAKEAEFSNTYRNLEHELKQKVGKDAQSKIHISVKQPAQTLRKAYFRLQDDVQKNALLATPAGKMWLRSLNVKPGTNSFDLDNLLFKGAKRLKDPQLNLAEAKQFNDSLRDSITTFGGEIGSNEQRLLRNASGQLTTAISNAYHKIDPELAKKYKQTNKAFSRWQKEDVPFLNKVNELSGEPEKIFGEALRDLDKGAKPLDTALRMSSGTKRSNISKGVLHELGNVDNTFDLPRFYEKFRGHSVKEQNRILKGLDPQERAAFDKGLSQYKSMLDIQSKPSLPARLFGAKNKHPDQLGFSKKDLAADLILGSNEAPSVRKMEKYKDLLDKNLSSKEKKSLINRASNLTEIRELGRASLASKDLVKEKKNNRGLYWDKDGVPHR